MRHTGKHGSVTQSILTGFSFAQFLNEIKKIADVIGFKGDNELLVIQAEGIGRIERHRGISKPNADMFIHHALTFSQGQSVPGTCLDERIDKEILLIVRGNDQAWVVCTTCILPNVDGTLRHREKCVCLANVWSHRTATNTTTHALQ